MSELEPPEGLADVTAEWLTAALGDQFGGQVAAVDATPIGTGQVADSARLALTWEPAGAGPDSLVAKVTTASETSRATARATRTYEIEVGFYSDLAPDLPVNAPRCYWAGYDDVACAYAVVLDDLAPAEQGDQMRGCTLDEAAAAAEELPLLHAPRWGDDKLQAYSWLNRYDADRATGMATLVAMMAPGFLERYESRLSAEVVELVQRFVPQTMTYFQPPAGPQTVVHGDFRNDNLMFGGPRVFVLDWQTVAIGPALSDLSYFLGGSILTDQRRAHERELVQHYAERMRTHGIDLPDEQAWDDYRRYAFSGLVMAIIASMLVERTERGDEMFITMADRAGLHALDLDAESFL